MNTLQAALAFTAVFISICAVIILNPCMYARTETMARLSVESQNENNMKRDIFEIRTQKKDSQKWEIAVSLFPSFLSGVVQKESKKKQETRKRAHARLRA